MAQRTDYRQALGRFTTGVAVITAQHGGERFAMTASALTSVSLDPILLLVCFSHDSDTRLAVRESGRFGLSVLGEDSVEAARELATNRPEGVDQLAALEVRAGPGDVPLLAQAVAHCVCSVDRILRAGSHDVVVGAVEWIDQGLDDAGPLVYYGGRFWRLGALADRPDGASRDHSSRTEDPQ